MPDQELITAYQRAHRNISFFKDLLQKACDEARNAKVSLARAWLAENYPEIPVRVLPSKDVELSVAIEVRITREDSEIESGKKLLNELYNELEQYLKSVREEVQ